MTRPLIFIRSVTNKWIYIYIIDIFIEKIICLQHERENLYREHKEQTNRKYIDKWIVSVTRLFILNIINGGCLQNSHFLFLKNQGMHYY